MARYDASNAKVQVFTFKDGLLSAMAHDLKLEVTRFELDPEGVSTFDAGSLRVVTPMKDGAESSGLLPTALYGEIEKNARNDVLNVKKHPQVKFEVVEQGADFVRGNLTLHGVTKALRGARSGDSAEFRLDVRDFGIKPFTAMLGALKVKPEVVVKVSLSREDGRGV